MATVAGLPVAYSQTRMIGGEGNERYGKMQTMVPKGRANYEPNSLAAHGEDGGPRESLERGFVTTNAATGPDEQGDKLRIRAERPVPRSRAATPSP